jgi:hypothetical protein
MKNIFSKFLTRKTRTKLGWGNTSEFGGLISPTKPLAIVDEPVEFTSTVDFANATVTGLSTDNYLEYTGMVRFNGVSDAPVVTVFKNTLSGNPVWTKDADGIYSITLAGAFPYSKTWVMANTSIPTANTSTFSELLYFYKDSSNSNVITIINNDLKVTVSDIDRITSDVHVAFQIRVYP